MTAIRSGLGAMLILLINACSHLVTPKEETPNLLVDIERAPDEVFSIWPGDPPGGVPEGLEEEWIERDNPFNLPDTAATKITNPTLSVFYPENPDGSAILIIPGGGYARVVMQKEGHEGARWFNKKGVTAYVLKYRLPQHGWKAGADTPLQDAQRAIRLIRKRAPSEGIDPDRIAVMGFSAGGHLAGSLLTRFDTGVYDPMDEADDVSARPDVGALIYPVISLDAHIAHMGSRTNIVGDKPSLDQVRKYSVDHEPPAATPPTFILHANDDKAVPVENALRAYESFRKQNIPVALNIFETGGHGFGFRGIDDAPLRLWPQLFYDFGRSYGVFGEGDCTACETGKVGENVQRTPFSGRILIAGDSTAADYPARRAPQVGWGQALPYFLSDDIEILNRAVNGRSTKSFIDEGKWDALMKEVTPGDLVLISFGHNDSRDDAPERFAPPFGSYRDNLVRFADDVHQAGAKPIILSSAARRLWEGPAMVETHGPYAVAAQQAARQAAASFIDLANLTLAYFEQQGNAGTKQDFLWGERLNIRTNQMEYVEDNTHFTFLGACGVARIIALELSNGVLETDVFQDISNGAEETVGRPPGVRDCAEKMAAIAASGE